MERMRIAALFADRESLDGKEVVVCGWARTIRDMKGFGFIELNDGSCFKNLQVVLDASVLDNYKEIAGQNVGAGKYDRVKKGMWVSTGMGVGYTIISGILLLIFAPQVIGVFSGKPDVVQYGIYVMKFFCPFYWLLGFLHVMAGTVRGTGKTFQTMVVFLVSLCVCRVIWIWAVLRIDHKLSYVMTAYPVTWLIGAVLIALYVWKGKWMPEAYYRMKKEG